ncbi:hypothetical protein BST63_03835 [Bradyrhizobium canariense]|uniref:Uncharacterized protein n=1 Tax=Bradyrhizobium canariense TaxID=255045 RepID=A0ABX3X9W7_9BRAD|nr:hypothetical protein BSR47_04030 [Bradyrhizobium canariense]OSJ34395.1 hypothetical protein BST63_03835 [Bradyrhizobium canariense]
MPGQINGVGDFGRAGLPDPRDVRVGPDDLRTIVVVEVPNAFTGIACDLAELDGVRTRGLLALRRQHSRGV